MVEIDNLRIAFQVHHAQLIEKRQKIHTMTSSTVGFLLVIIGWLMTTSVPLETWTKVILLSSIIILTVISCANLYTNSKSYVSIAKVVNKINHHLGFFEEKDPLYPKSWKNFGKMSAFRTMWHHAVSIITFAILCNIIILLK